MAIKEKRILVTGGAGFIGSHLVDALIAQGIKVSVIDDLSTGKKNNLNPRAKFYNLDIASPEVKNVFKKEKPEVVFHLAFNTNVPKSIVDPLFDAQGVMGSLNIFSTAVQTGVSKIIMASSAFIYGNYPASQLPVTEKYLHQPISPYAISKMASENYLRYFAANYPIAAVIFRYATVYGPRQVAGAMADYIRCIASGRGGEMYGDGNLTRDYVYVSDIVKANLLALDYAKPRIVPVFNLGSMEETKLNLVHKKIANLLGWPDIKPIYRPARTGELKRYFVSNALAKRQLGWRPTVDLDKGLAQTVEYYRERLK